MKINFYADVYPGVGPEFILLTPTPSPKPEGCKRFKVEIEFPDEIFNEGDTDGTAHANKPELIE